LHRCGPASSGWARRAAAMARAIVDAGFPTTLWARRPESLAPYVDTAAAVAATPRALGAACDVLGVCVVNDADVDAVLRGPDGALAGMAPGGVVLVHSTTRPETCVRLQEDHPALHVLDAPVSGGGHRAANRTLLVMVGGDVAAFARVRRCSRRSRTLWCTSGRSAAGSGPAAEQRAVHRADRSRGRRLLDRPPARPRRRRAERRPAGGQRSQLRGGDRRRCWREPRRLRRQRREPARQGRGHPHRVAGGGAEPAPRGRDHRPRRAGRGQREGDA